ncbi:DnaD domain-containing protein [Radiobacillus sp. PE A8.2]|uniref:DnaD domain-containing protein n=1 Tax=Radiobacillus sp. PE A8.2 TaxID=3380349 RepID=UPI00388DF721
MNYIKEINAFYHQIEINPLSLPASNLWHALMHMNNKTCWQETFTVAQSVLCYKANLTESTFKRARTELVEKGYITFESQRGRQAPIYQMTSLYAMMDHSADDNSDYNMDDKVNRNLDHKPDPLIKQKDIEKEKKIPTTDAHAFYRDNYGEIRAYMQNELSNRIAKLGDDMVVEAMKRALDQGKEHWGYVKYILETWLHQGITTVEAARQERIAFLTQHKPQKKKKKTAWTGKKDVVPGWFEKRGQSVTNNTPTTSAALPDISEVMLKYQSRLVQ